MLTQHAESAMCCLREAKEAYYRQHLLVGPLQRQQLRLAGILVKLQQMVTQQAAGAPTNWTDLPWGQLRHLAALSLQKKLSSHGLLTASPVLTAEVAAIDAEAMDGHMIFTCKLRARVLKASDVHPDLFKVC